jgi:membrane protease YdiL (CAAX protease family)
MAVMVGLFSTIAAFVAVGAAIGIVMGAQGASGAEVQVRIKEVLQQPFLALLLSLIPAQLGMTAVLLVAARRSKESIKQRLGLVPQTGPAFGGFKLATMAAFTVSTALASLILSSLLIKPPTTQHPINDVIANGSWWTITLLSIILSSIPALVEECLFRGYLQRRFLQRWSPGVAIGLSTLLFASVHLDSLQHMIAVVPLGVITGLLAYRTNSVKPGMLVHSVHNAAVVGFASIGNGLSGRIGDETLGLLAIGTIAILGLIGLPAVVSLLRRAKPLPAVETCVAPAMVAVGT